MSSRSIRKLDFKKAIIGCLLLFWQLSAYIIPIIIAIAQGLECHKLIKLIVPCIITIALSLVQILAGFLLTPVVSFACVCGLYVVSAYYTTWPLVGNYTMWVRTKWITPDGVHPISGFILAIVLIICAWNAGEYYLSKKDLF
ncbi:MAG: hypothetical protein Q4D54_00830 [Eubacteriales bacterium]|nr:hypothetical protein [Eubacteriales bacterium]